METRSVDVAATSSILRRLDLVLRTTDALNIAFAQRIGAALAAFDERMATCADMLGGPVSSL